MYYTKEIMEFLKTENTTEGFDKHTVLGKIILKALTIEQLCVE